jgi:hypothetical protein
MDIALLLSFLTPCLPFLLNLGDKAAGKAAEKVGEKSLETVGKIWEKLRPKVETKEAAKEAAEDVAKDPENPAFQTVLQVQLEKILAQNPDLAAEVAQLLEEAKAQAQSSGVNVTMNIGSMSGNAKAIGSVQGNVTM